MRNLGGRTHPLEDKNSPFCKAYIKKLKTFKCCMPMTSAAARLSNSMSESTQWLNMQALSCKGCPSLDWGSDTELTVKASRSVGASRRLAITVGQVVGSATQVWSVDTIAISQTHQKNVAQTGSASLTIQGQGFSVAASTMAMRMESTQCRATMWESES